ncbi:3'(2'),5'-bisphosphate nucleotidase CysQ [Sphingomonas qomolangmaensis]|uniref:3'(2'),5'-bisphosphate nucleotidase CysQ n=1 Tax=Sphingomonas qomolangmaensis TaxID=2918765 RepID=A0ABY5LAT8_9SPHN|nr:3'(2'),5'-bisphosphate nucleotidase CysQ [Sphingomonas qomolangmaensis]UUL82997.1 3'(2'),5'-bisphosphate nucleotidase CysQ [Sphingomonas qomolangmaensis]
MEPDAVNDARLAADIATEAGALLLALQGTMAPCRELGTAGDAQANRLILDRLRDARPEDFVLSEEAADDPARCAAQRLWVVDPLDGTREYAEGRDDWAVHIGLSIDGVAVTGAVALPGLGVTLASDAPPPLAPLPQRPRMVVSRSRPPAEAVKVADALGAERIPMGSAGAKAMAVVRGTADIYLHAGGQYAWDNCAPAAVAIATGLHVSRIDGSPLVYNCIDVSVPDLLICRIEWADRVLALLAQAD